MPHRLSPGAPGALTRRGLLRAAALAAAAGPFLAACGSGGKHHGPGTTSQSDLAKVLPAYLPSKAVTPDIPPVTGANGAVSDPCFLSYPTNPVRSVAGTPGAGGSYVATTPLWGAIPPSSGNGYYDTVNAALGATLKMQPSDGNNYGNLLPPLFAANKLPDWIDIPGWNTTNLDFGEAVQDKFVDLTDYLAGDKAKKYPNLANVSSLAWTAGVWNGRLYGIPIYPAGAQFVGMYYYRKDIFDKHGIDPASVTSAQALTDLGKELTDAKAGRWAFDDLFGNSAAYVLQPFGIPGKWGTDDSGKLIYKYEHPGMIEALNWHAKLVKAGYVHPDAVAANSQNAKQRFWSGKVAVCADGTGAWKGDDATSGKAANPSYERQAFDLFSADGSTTPTIELQPDASMFSYLNKNLSHDQIEECLAIANYLAAPYGSAEWLTVNFGAEGEQYTMKDGNPVLTKEGSKVVATTFQFLASPPSVTTPVNGFTQVAKDYCAWQGRAVQRAVKPLFYSMNVTEPSQYSSIGKAVDDTMNDVKVGRKPISAYKEAVETWRKQGGDALRDFYENIRSKYGTNQ